MSEWWFNAVSARAWQCCVLIQENDVNIICPSYHGCCQYLVAREEVIYVITFGTILSVLG